MSPDAATERPILYISGPYSPGYGRTVEDNIRIAREYATRAWNRGWAAITPHLNTAGFELDCTDLRHEDWLAGDLSILSHLDPARSAVLMLPRWKQSKGARLEFKEACKRGFPVYFSTDILGGVPRTPAPGTRCPDGKTCPARREAR